MGRFLLVCLGGALGTGARYLIGGWAFRTFGMGFPVGTLAVNLIGSLLIMFVMHVGFDKGALSPDVRMVLTSGVLGGFTTYSSFNFETTRLLQQGAVGLGFLYVAVTLLGCLAAGMLGLYLGRLVAGT